MKTLFSFLLITSLVFISCSKSAESKTTKIGPFDVTVITDSSVKYFIQNTDIPILLDSMVLNLYGITDDVNFYNYVENFPINPGTSLEQFTKSVFKYNLPVQTVNNPTFNLNVLYNWSTRFYTQSFKTSANTNNSTNQVLNPLNYKNNIIVTNGFFLGLDVNVSPSNPVLVPGQNLDKFLVTRKSLISDIRVFAIKKNSIISKPPVIKNYDGRMISFSESANYYYLYFYPMTTVSYDLSTVYNNLIYYNGVDLLNQVRSWGCNFIKDGSERVYIIEFIKDNSGSNIINLNSIIRKNELY